MGISSDEARRIQFSGSEHSYAGSEVEEFRRQVVQTLAAYENDAARIGEARPAPESASAPVDDPEEMAAAQRIRQQAVQLAERMLRDVMGASADDGTYGLETWQEAAILKAAAEEEMEFAREESRRLPAMAAAERDEIRAKHEQELAQLRAELQKELQASRFAAGEEADSIRAQAAAEAEEMLDKALGTIEERRFEAESQAHRMERRIAVLQTALADAESRFRRLAATAANEVGTLTALADQDLDNLSQAPPDLHVATVDLTNDSFERVGQDARASESSAVDEEEGFVKRDPDVGFYQRRLAGLRDRLEKSGHPPESSS